MSRGDGSSGPGTIVLDGSGNATGSVTGSHTYSGDNLGGAGSGLSEGSATITVTISHEGVAASPVTDSVTINEVQIVPTGGKSFTRDEGSASVSGEMATFTDAGGLEEGG